MRILYLHQYFTTPEIGGGTRSYEFGKRLVKKGYDVEFISGPFMNNHYQGQKCVEIEGMKVHVVGRTYSNAMAYGNRMISFLIYAIATSIKGLFIKKPDIIYATSTPLTVAIPAILLSWYWKIPFVFEVRDLWPEAPIQMGALKNAFLIKAMRYLESLTYIRASHIVVLSPGMKKGVMQAGIPETKITLIPNSSDIQLFNDITYNHNEVLRKYDINTKNVVLYAGALGEANGLDIILGAAKLLQESKEDVHILIAGDGKKLQFLKEQKQNLRLENITFAGGLSKQEIARLYKVAKASLVIFKQIPVLMTNSPNKFFDSLASGTPVISNMKGWIECLIKANAIGLYFEGTNVNQLVSNILQIVKDDKLRVEMKKNASKLAKEQFAREKLATEIERVVVKSMS